MALPRRRISDRVVRVVPYLNFALSAIFLLSFHVYAADTLTSDNATLRERLRKGPEALEPLDKVLFAVLILLSFELLDFFSKHSGSWFRSKLIPVRGKHLDELTVKDQLFIGISKAATAPFVYFYLRFAYFEPNVVWDLANLRFANTVAPLLALFIVYDFFYTILHWALHIKAIYGYIHKHHHHQKAPSRANVDAVNVHPVEFFLGEYNHLWTLFLCTRVAQIHILGSLLFLAIGGFLAGINHTRYDMVVSFWGVRIFDSKAHDVHHRIPQSNYGQYTMFWDWVFQSYRAYNPNDRVNPEAQLDLKTGKSMEYGKRKKVP
jgi:sterol desaturase/sphingolipid hydroxylase (fatty acid hydroxylase superfamily)